MKRIKHIPGIISLISLPILCIFYLHSNNYFKKAAIDLTFCDKYNFERNEVNKFVCLKDALVEDIHEKTFVLSNNLDWNEKEFKRFQEYSNDFKKRKKENYYSTFQVEDSIQYQYVIELLNEFYRNDIRLYSLENNTMYFVPYYEIKSNNINCEIKIIEL